MSFNDCDNTQRMGFVQDEWGDLNALRFKRKFRWKFIIPDISASGVNSLPPVSSARPNLTFSEIRAEHLNETIYYPGKPDWRTINLVLYDIVKPHENPVFSWIKRAYNPTENGPQCAAWYPSLDEPSLKAIATLKLYDGCGCVIEEWRYEHVWPQSVDFGDLEMNNSEYLTANVTLRFDRAYIREPSDLATINYPDAIGTCTNSDGPPCPIPEIKCENGDQVITIPPSQDQPPRPPPPPPDETPGNLTTPFAASPKVRESKFSMLW